MEKEEGASEKKLAMVFFLFSVTKVSVQMDSKRSKSIQEGILRIGQKRAWVGHFCQKAKPKKIGEKHVLTGTRIPSLDRGARC